MTDQHPSQGWDDAHALSGAYAVDALDDIERARFEAHLRGCADCRDEVDSLREAAALLGTDEAAPPVSVRDAVLAGIQGIRPLPPVTQPDEPAARHARRTASRLPLMVAAAVVLLLTVGAALLRPWADEEPSPAPLTAAEQVLAAADATRVEKNFPDGAHATVVVSRTVGRAVILTEDMAPAPDGKDYQLWLQTPAGEMQSAGVMPDVRTATKVLDGDAARATGVGITVEPDGGSEQPTSEPIAFFALDS